LRVFDISDKERLFYSVINKIVIKIIALIVWWGTELFDKYIKRRNLIWKMARKPAIPELGSSNQGKK